MYVPYKDILERISQPPKWWCRGVPRYDDFQPSATSVYARAALLVKSRCQRCSHEFIVGFWGTVSGLIKSEFELGDMHDDPPYHEVESRPDPRCVGNSMTFVISEIIEAWWRAPSLAKRADGDMLANLGRWIRLPKLEGPKAE